MADPDFQVRTVAPLMPTNALWRHEVGHGNDVGLLLEVHTVGCISEMLSLARCWWPLTGAHVSKSLNVSFLVFLSISVHTIFI